MDSIILIEIIFTVAVVFLQLTSFGFTRRRALELAGLFPGYDPIATVQTASVDGQGDGPRQSAHAEIQPREGVSTFFRAILDGTNQYLRKNAGAPADFQILQDIAERVSNSVEHRAAANATLPLYIGLMGTFVGVIIGLTAIARDPSSSIADSALKRFLGGVLVAMAGSLCGLLLTVIARGAYLHRAQSENDNRKNAYFTFLQTELLPAVGHDVSVVLQTLQVNLHRFNADFKSNLSLFTGAMSAAADAVDQQKQLLQTIKNAQFTKIIASNSEMFIHLQAVVPNLKDFVGAVSDFQQRLTLSAQIADKLSQILNRLTTFEESINTLGHKLATDDTVTLRTVELIRAQVDALKGRNQLITQFVDSQDEEVKRYLAEQQHRLSDLTNNANQQLAQLSDEIAHSVAEAFGPERVSVVLADVARLKLIDERLRGIESQLHQWRQSAPDRETVRAIVNALQRTKPAQPFLSRVRRAIDRAFVRGASGK